MKFKIKKISGGPAIWDITDAKMGMTFGSIIYSGGMYKAAMYIKEASFEDFEDAFDFINEVLKSKGDDLLSILDVVGSKVPGDMK